MQYLRACSHVSYCREVRQQLWSLRRVNAIKLTSIIDVQLDILAANASGGRLAGSVLLNGTQRRPAEFRKRSCYVMQRDVLLDSATVRDSELERCFKCVTDSHACMHTMQPFEMRQIIVGGSFS